MIEKQEEKQKEKEEEEQQKLVDYESKWKRALADYRNLQKRVAKERQDLARFSNRELILKLLPVLDDLEEAVQKSGDEGYEKILNKLKEVLEEEGLEEIKVEEGSEFDPRIMEGRRSPEALAKGEVQPQKVQKAQRAQKGEGVQPQKAQRSTQKTQKEKECSEEGDKQKVVNKMVRKGYNMKGELLRPARVVVGS